MRSIWYSVDTLQCKSVKKSFCKLFSSLHTLSKFPMHCYTCSHHNTPHKLRPVLPPLADDTYYALLPFPAAPLLKLLKQNLLYCSLPTFLTSWGLLSAPLHTAMYYALLFFRAAPLLKLLKQIPRFCSLLKPSVGCWKTKV